MDNVLNRPLFQHRSAGVQRFNVGGKVFADLSGAIVRQYRQPSVVPMGTIPSPVSDEMLNFERVLLRGVDPYLYDRDTGQVRLPDGSRLSPDEQAIVSSLLRQQEEESSESGLAALQRELALKTEQSQAAIAQNEGATGTRLAEEAGLIRKAIPEAEAALAEVRDRAVMTYPASRGLTALEGPEAVVSQMSPEQLDIFNNLDRAANNPTPDVPAPDVPAPDVPAPKVAVPGSPILGPSGMEMEARGLDAEDNAAQQGPDFERTGRQGPLISNPSEVATGLNAEDPVVREKTLEDFMKEFTDAAPKYEGIDKNLMLAQIGFAIAAGESPNAMQNIANGLLAGSDMMIKDKAAKDEFNRQVQLSAMQYGLEGKAQDRALEREIAKEDRALGRQFTDYVASKEVTYRGTKYGPNESIPVLHSDIIGGNMPDGVVSESLSDAMTVNNTALRKALLEAEENQTLSPEQYRASIADIDKAADAFSKARNTIPLIEASIIRNAKGEVTGLKPALQKAVNQAASALGIKLEGLDSVEKYNSAMQTVAARMVQDILGEAGNNISNVDRSLVDAIVGVAAGGYGNIFKDQGVLNAKLQEILQQAESKQQSALDTYNTLMEGLGGTYTPSGTAFRSEKAERVFNPEESAPKFEYLIDESGKYVKRYLGGGE
jgi:hypothetical protein